MVPGHAIAEHRRGAPGRAVRAGPARAPGTSAGGVAGHAAPPRGGAARHDLGAGPIARAGGVRPPGGRSAGRGSSGPTGGRGAPRSSTGPTPPASCRSRTGRPMRSSAGPGWPRGGAGTARGQRQELRRGAGPPASRGAADGQRAGRRQEGGPVVGLVGDQDRRRVAARHRRAGVPSSGGGSNASTTWPSAPSPPNCWRRSGRTRSAPRGSSPRRDARSAWRRRPTWPCTTGCRARWSAGRCPSTELTEVAVEGWKQPAFADPAALGGTGHAGAGPERPAVALRLAPLVPRPGGASLRAAPPARGLHAEGEAHLRLLRHARAGRHAARRSRRSGPTGRRARGQAGDAPPAERSPTRGAVRCAEAASWVGCTEVLVERVEPESARSELDGLFWRRVRSAEQSGQSRACWRRDLLEGGDVAARRDRSEPGGAGRSGRSPARRTGRPTRRTDRRNRSRARSASRAAPCRCSTPSRPAAAQAASSSARCRRTASRIVCGVRGAAARGPDGDPVSARASPPAAAPSARRRRWSGGVAAARVPGVLGASTAA